MSATGYVNSEVNNLLFSGEWEQECIKEGNVNYHKYTNRNQDWGYNFINDADKNLAYRVKYMSSTDCSMHEKIKSALKSAGVTQFIVASKEVGEYEQDCWVELFLTNDNYEKIKGKKNETASLPSLYTLENKIKEKLSPLGGTIYLDTEQVPKVWFDKYQDIKKEELGKDYSPAWNVPSKKQLILKLAEHYGLF